LKKSIFFALIVLPLFYGNISAQSHPTSEDHSIKDSGSVHHDLNELAVFAGVTAKTEKKGTYFSLGLDYVRFLSSSEKWGAGAFAEIIFTKHPEWVFGALLYFRFYDKFLIRTGPGIEIIKHEEIDPECNCTHVKSETEFLYRIGVGYSHHTKNLIITPTIDMDLVRSETALVFGLNIGIAF
jgi:hypothetical protein